MRFVINIVLNLEVVIIKKCWNINYGIIIREVVDKRYVVFKENCILGVLFFG